MREGYRPQLQRSDPTIGEPLVPRTVYLQASARPSLLATFILICLHPWGFVGGAAATISVWSRVEDDWASSDPRSGWRAAWAYRRQPARAWAHWAGRRPAAGPAAAGWDLWGGSGQDGAVGTAPCRSAWGPPGGGKRGARFR